MIYTELQVTTNFSFLRGASHGEELLMQAHHYGYDKLAITDRNSLAGIVRMHGTAKINDMKTIIGCRLDLQDGHSLLAYPTDLDAYSRLSNLLTIGKRRAVKGECNLTRKDVYEHSKGMKFILVSPEKIDLEFESCLKEYREAFGRELSLAATHYYHGNDAKRLAWLSRLASNHFTPLVATNDVHYHAPIRRELQDVLTCIREKCTIHTAGQRLLANAERYLKPEHEMKRLFREFPEALKRTQHIAEACRFSLDELKYDYPSEITSDGRSPQEELEYQTWNGVTERLGNVVPLKIQSAIKRELAFIKEVGYAPYFLTVFDIVRFARSRNILCQGRGSAANSAVCYYLGITSVDPSKFDLLFERFISNARNEPPDIDVDFEHERREEVMQYIFERFGRERAAIIATVQEYQQRGALRDVGKALGMSEDTMKGLSHTLFLHLKEWVNKDRLKERGLDDTDPIVQKVVELSYELLSFPRHLGQHTGGFVITEGKLSDLCPIMNASMVDRTNIEWNKDDIDTLGFMKIDVLALGMLTCIRKGFDMIKLYYDQDYTLASIPQDDPATYEMISRADTIGVFQIESRAQMTMLPRLKPKCFYDLVIQVAIVRPGPIQGDMVHPYLRRREGSEKVEYPSEALREILERTLGVPLFQEQAMKIAIVAAGFSAAEADQLRRSMATFKRTGGVNQFEGKLVNGMVKNGYTEDFARRCFRQFQGFASYGFPESHAASFAHLVYTSAWTKCHYPDVFAAALLNSQPMGFYMPAQIVRNAQENGVTVRPVDVNDSEWDCTLEEQSGKYKALRLGFREIKGIRFEDIERLVSKRDLGYTDIATLWQRAGISTATLESLANADAFKSMGLNRREALWQIKALGERPLSLFDKIDNEGIYEPSVILPRMTLGEHVLQDYSTTSLSLKGHPIQFLRSKLTLAGVVPAERLKTAREGSYMKLAGLVLVRQRPSTAQGIVFLTIEDETGVVNAITFKHVVEKFRKQIMDGKMLMVAGKFQRQGMVMHLIVRQIQDFTYLLREIGERETEMPLLLSRADEIKHGIRGSNHTNIGIPASKDFK